LHSGIKENGFVAQHLYVEFKSLSHRHIKRNPLIERLAGFLHSGIKENGFVAQHLYVEFKFLSHRHIDTKMGTSLEVPIFVFEMA